MNSNLLRLVKGSKVIWPHDWISWLERRYAFDTHSKSWRGVFPQGTQEELYRHHSRLCVPRFSGLNLLVSTSTYTRLSCWFWQKVKRTSTDKIHRIARFRARCGEEHRSNVKPWVFLTTSRSCCHHGIHCVPLCVAGIWRRIGLEGFWKSSSKTSTKCKPCESRLYCLMRVCFVGGIFPSHLISLSCVIDTLHEQIAEPRSSGRLWCEVILSSTLICSADSSLTATWTTTKLRSLKMVHLQRWSSFLSCKSLASR